MRAPRLVAVGDLLLGDAPITVGWGFRSRFRERRADAPLAAAGALLRHADVVLGNLEVPLTSHGAGATRWKADQMRGDPAYATLLARAGFTALHVANNHAMQHGERAFADTVAALRAAGIAAVGLRGGDGWCAEPVRLRVAGALVGLLGYCWRPRQYLRDAAQGYAEGTLDEVLADVRRLRAEGARVVISMHWGEDFVTLPSAEEARAAQAIVDAGATVVVGHHPQVLRPVERHAAGVIAYSLGNFVADLRWMPEFLVGGVLRCTLGANGAEDATVQQVALGADCVPRPVGAASPASSAAAPTLDAAAYAAAARRAAGRQRRLAYAWALRHAWRYPPAVLAELVLTTVRNRLPAPRRRGHVAGTTP